MLERMWSEGNYHPLLVGMQTCSATVENQCGGFSGNWESTSLRTQQFHSWEYTQEMPYHTTKVFVKLCS